MRWLMGLVVVAVLIGGGAFGALKWVPDLVADETAQYFPDRLEVSLDTEDGRTAILLKDFRFIDSGGLEWKAPKGMVSDGASIPGSLWSIVGGPWSGPHRKAAVVHDFYCMEENLTRPWQDVHWMFYEALIAADVDPVTAKAMYLGVYRFGPRWENLVTPSCADVTDPSIVCVQSAPVLKAQVLMPTRDEVDIEALLAEAARLESLPEADRPGAEEILLQDYDRLNAIEANIAVEAGQLEPHLLSEGHTPWPVE